MVVSVDSHLLTIVEANVSLDGFTITGGTVGSLKASYHHAVKKIEKILTDN